jgi:hypothetical protein
VILLLFFNIVRKKIFCAQKKYFAQILQGGAKKAAKKVNLVK